MGEQQGISRKKKEFSILYVDDEPPNLRGFKSSFRRKYNVFISDGPSEALQIVKSTKIDLVVTDHRMPDILGTELLRDIYEYDPNIKRMILSGFIKRHELNKAVGSFGIHEFATKPWDLNELLKTFEKLLNNDPKIKFF